MVVRIKKYVFIPVRSYRFPTIYFAPMNNKDKPMKYAGARDVKSFVEYLQREATNTFKLPSAEKKKKSKKSKDEL